MAQKPKTNYLQRWKNVDVLLKEKGLTASALKEVETIYALAKKEKQEAEIIKAIVYITDIQPQLEEDGEVNALKKIADEIKTSVAPVKNLLQSLLATRYLQYLRNNRWHLYDATPISGNNTRGLETWSPADFHEQISSLYLASISSSELLKSTTLSPYETIIIKGNTRKLRPTLYDLLSHQALEYFTSGENDLTKPSYRFEINDPKSFAPANEFLKSRFITSDTSSLHFRALKIYQELLAFHIQDKEPSAFLDADIDRLAFMQSVSVLPNKNELYKKAMSAIATSNPSNEYGGLARFLILQQEYEDASKYDPKTSPAAMRFALVDIAIRLSAISKDFKGTRAAAMSTNLLHSIEAKDMVMETEKVNLPGAPFLSRVSYRNLQKIYYRIIALNDLDFSNERFNEKYWDVITRKKSIRQVTQDLPDPKDKRMHSVEIKIDALPEGQYAILASKDPDFSLGNNLLSLQYLHVSNISYISRDNHFFVLHRNSGQPLASASVQLWEAKYDYKTSKPFLEKKNAFSTNANGYVLLPVTNSYLPEVTYKNDRLFTRDQQYNYRYDRQPMEKERTFLFTDRSIYRPGQQVYFKGILVGLDSGGRKSHVVPDRQTVIHLYDANGELKDSVSLKTNAFGSYNGSFLIPENLLNGEFSLRDEKNNAFISFRVEEYKRPTFEVSFDTVKTAFRLGDTVSIKGKVSAYAGNMLDNSTVNYRVTRKTRFPWPWRFGGWNIQREEMEITHGKTLTDESGNFTINFLAIPDPTTDKHFDPVFDFEITAEATDDRGETRNGLTSLSIGYKALNLQLETPEVVSSDSLKDLKITVSNFAGQFQTVQVDVIISRLQSPTKLIRPRYWSAPDTSVLTKEDFIRFFPNDEFMEENAKSNWNQLNTVYTGSAVLAAGKNFPLSSPLAPRANTVFAPGWYLVEAKAKDQYGEEVIDKKYVQVIDAKTLTPAQPLYEWSVSNSLVAEPGQTVKYNFGSSADDLWIIRLVDKKTEPVKPLTAAKKSKPALPQPTDGPFEFIRQNKEIQTLSIPVTEEDRGGFMISQVFVKNNRVFDKSTTVSVPWTNKDLNVSVQTFRDKIAPGSKEQWTLKITGNKGEQTSAEILTSLYDESLDQFLPHRWNLPAVFPVMYNSSTWNRNGNFELSRSLNKNIAGGYVQVPEKVYDRLQWESQLFSYRGYMDRGMVQKSMAAPSAVMDEEIALADSAASKSNLTGIPVTKIEDSNPPPSIQTRKNFSETAFFFPELHTDEAGNVSFSFTIPEALTRWKWQTIAHTKEMATGMAIRSIVTQKDLMVQPNMPRFLREGDRISLSARISNLTNKEMTGQAWLQLLDPETQLPVDGLFKNKFPQQQFTASAGKNALMKFDVEVPENYNKPLQYRILASSGNNSDGEENILPVLSNRILVTESLPLIMRGNGTKPFTFNSLVKAPVGGTLTQHRFTMEYSSNPAWYGVLALPYLMEYPYECAEQQFNRFYANALASSIANSSPRIKAMFETWRASDTSALISNLMKNPELKSIMLEQTPWVMEAKSESEQRKNIALLFDLVRLGKEQSSTLNALQKMQLPNGAFPWFTGGPDDRYITQYIMTGIAHLTQLNALPTESNRLLDDLTANAITYLDKKLLDDYETLIKQKADLTKNQLGAIQVQYLYMRSSFNKQKVNKEAQKAVDFYAGQAKKFWLSQNRYGQGMIAIAMNRKGEKVVANSIIKSLEENAIKSSELGMYWKENVRGYSWYQSPIETHALLIEAFDEVAKDKSSVEELKLWLLSQKRVQGWGTTKATADAVYALLRTGNDWLRATPEVIIKAGEKTFTPQHPAEAGTGYFKETISGPAIQPSLGNISVTIKNNVPGSVSWGAAYWQYFEQIKNIKASATPLKLDKKFFIQKNSDRGPVLIALKDGDVISVGEKLIVRIEIRSDRQMEYIHMKDLRASGTEPVNVLSEYKWQGGLGYYEATRDASTDFFFSNLPKGAWIFEYPLFVTHNGKFSAGITTIQSMYAPEFNAHSEGSEISVK